MRFWLFVSVFPNDESCTSQFWLFFLYVWRKKSVSIIYPIKFPSFFLVVVSLSMSSKNRFLLKMCFLFRFLVHFSSIIFSKFFFLFIFRLVFHKVCISIEKVFFFVFLIHFEKYYVRNVLVHGFVYPNVCLKQYRVWFDFPFSSNYIFFVVCLYVFYFLFRYWNTQFNCMWQVCVYISLSHNNFFCFFFINLIFNLEAKRSNEMISVSVFSSSVCHIYCCTCLSWV